MEWLSHLPVLVVILLSASHGTGGVMNCIEARHQCLNEKQCGDVLLMLHKVCGPELVACATTTPSKCQMLLRTLGTFDYLTSCVCSEPHMDHTCHTFRETIFNHPCARVTTTGYSPTLMPNCNEADDSCKAKASCLSDYLQFANSCTFSGITCTAQESEKCMESWNKIRHSPIFGCVCSDQSMRALPYSSGGELTSYSTLRKGSEKQETCITRYNRTHENPCLAGQQDISQATTVETTQATCHVALDNCQSDEECKPLLSGVMVWCEHSHCEPDRCRSALQDFYDRVSILHRLQVAFCVCRQSDPDGECLTAMRKLHPTCAERHSGRDPMKCHKIADQCRMNDMCRKKLEDYEQNCAADAMTGRCADTHRSCQKAVMNILGTELHATCICKGTDFLHQHDCYTWQKLLWSNPCVIESHLMLHKEIADGVPESLDAVFRRPTLRTTPTPRLTFVDPTDEETKPDFIGSPGDYGIIQEYSPEGAAPRPEGTYGYEHPGWDSSRRTGISLGGNGRRQPTNNDRDRLNFGRGRYDGSGGPENGRGSGRNRGISIGGSNDRKPYNGIMTTEFEYGGGRNRGVGLSVAHNGGRNGHEETGSGGRNRGSHRRISADRERNHFGGSGRTYDGSVNGYGRGTGHRGTQIEMGPNPDRGNGQDIGNTGRGRGGRLGGTFGGRSPDERTYLMTHSPPRHFEPVTPTPPALPVPTTQTTTTTTIPTTTLPRRTCTIKNVKNDQMATLQIPEGSRRRIYNTSDCSELCECRAPNRAAEPEAMCTTLRCIENKSCNTESAKFPHSAPYYQAYRGVCDCYAGNFICQKPDPDNYNLGPGVYMFLGYSKGEMEILKPVTSKNELDALNIMEAILVKDYGFNCSLTLKHHIGENVIAVAKLEINPAIYVSDHIKQQREKKECVSPLMQLAEKINSRPRHSDILMDAHLSMFILAEVDVNFPEAHTSSLSGATHLRPDFAVTYLATLLTLLRLLHHRRHLERMVPVGVPAT